MAADVAGLCATCRHARRVASARGSVFWLCARSADDPRFPKYPRLPVLRCEGHEPPQPFTPPAPQPCTR
ncbi:MAG: hypothetical protein DMD84_25435 [Candidatus Rokuibacteriota bacterium]|nr:MAG: hypothetical protein DME13_24490 [Candidatus Rokubacteria bacterium]PYO46682.1 MAG: hypothetical protein DMD84_25435 [Candidatus Rokubacteria bacterium]